ncbi:Uncharacterised protein [Delftia tsuruhatensis]|nr:Uncharacterised protein [Delftia tsuruhatensis]CAC9676880.1 Uncharacterised protein [Delftia tsuruhatensis]
MTHFLQMLLWTAISAVILAIVLMTDPISRSVV